MWEVRIVVIVRGEGDWEVNNSGEEGATVVPVMTWVLIHGCFHSVEIHQAVHLGCMHFSLDSIRQQNVHLKVKVHIIFTFENYYLKK